MTASDKGRVRQTYYVSGSRPYTPRDSSADPRTSHVGMWARHSRNQIAMGGLAAPLSEAQPDLFGAARPTDPLTGLAVKLPDTCGKCGHLVAIVGLGKTPHYASLLCRSCGAHRGWLSRVNYTFLNEIVNKFGAPTEPIIFRSRSTKPARTATELVSFRMASAKEA